MTQVRYLDISKKEKVESMGMSRLDELIEEAYETLGNQRPNGVIIEVFEFAVCGRMVWAETLSEACKSAQIALPEGTK